MTRSAARDAGEMAPLLPSLTKSLRGQVEVPPAQAIAMAGTPHGQGKFHQAEQACRQILSARPQFADAHNILGVTPNELGDGSESLGKRSGRRPEARIFDPECPSMTRIRSSVSPSVPSRRGWRDRIRKGVGLLGLLTCGVLVSCTAAPPPSPGACGVTGTADWRAWIDATSASNSRPMLIVTGKVTVPTAGWRFAWRDLRVMESYPVQIAAELEAIPPSHRTSHTAITHDLRGEWPIDPPVGSFAVHCGSSVIARVSGVEVAR